MARMEVRRVEPGETWSGDDVYEEDAHGTQAESIDDVVESAAPVKDAGHEKDDDRARSIDLPNDLDVVEEWIEQVKDEDFPPLTKRPISASTIRRALSGADFPASRSHLIDTAVLNGAPPRVIAMLRGLPGRRRFSDRAAVLAGFEEDDLMCTYPRRTTERPHTKDVGLRQVLSGKPWRRVTYPFEHVVADELLAPDFYRAFESQVRGLRGEFRRDMPNYDASAYHVTSNDDGPLAVFCSRQWHDMVADVMGVAATKDVNIALHHHEVGSVTGEVHNDLSPGWFVDEGRPDGITMADPSRCGYRHGDYAIGRPYERVRAVAILIYVGNDRWFPGDGGETGLYLASDQPVDAPSLAIPPRNNTLLAFECTPTSFHSFITNRRSARTSMIQWLHRTREEAVARWGEVSIDHW